MVKLINIDNCVSAWSVFEISKELGLTNEFEEWKNQLDNTFECYGTYEDETFNCEDTELLHNFLVFCGGNYQMIIGKVFDDDLFRVMRV